MLNRIVVLSLVGVIGLSGCSLVKDENVVDSESSGYKYDIIEYEKYALEVLDIAYNSNCKIEDYSKKEYLKDLILDVNNELNKKVYMSEIADSWNGSVEGETTYAGDADDNVRQLTAEEKRNIEKTLSDLDASIEIEKRTMVDDNRLKTDEKGVFIYTKDLEFFEGKDSVTYNKEDWVIFEGDYRNKISSERENNNNFELIGRVEKIGTDTTDIYVAYRSTNTGIGKTVILTVDKNGEIIKAYMNIN